MKTRCAQSARRAPALLAASVLASLLLLTSCGGGGGSSPPPSPLTVTTTSIPEGITGQAYSQFLAASGGKKPYAWTIASGSLPVGLVLLGSGYLNGVTSEAGLSEFTVQVTDAASHSATRPLSLRVVEELVITSPFEPVSWLNEPYTQTLEASGGTKPYTWTATGDVPPGLTLSSDGVLSGTPTQYGHWVFNIHISDAGPPVQTVWHSFDVVVYKRLQITTSRLPAGRPNVPYRVTISIERNESYHEYAPTITSGSLPSGLVVNDFSFEIRGVPTAEGTFDFTLEITETTRVVQTASKALSLTISSNLGRNDSPATATPISNGTFRASISPYSDPVEGPAFPDNDYYALAANPGAIITVETLADRLTPASPLDSVIEVVDADGNRFTTCRPGDDAYGLFDRACLNDDIWVGISHDSRLQFQVPGTGTDPVTFYVHVLDWRGSARPDFVYDLIVSGAN